VPAMAVRIAQPANACIPVRVSARLLDHRQTGRAVGDLPAARPTAAGRVPRPELHCGSYRVRRWLPHRYATSRVTTTCWRRTSSTRVASSASSTTSSPATTTRASSSATSRPKPNSTSTAPTPSPPRTSRRPHAGADGPVRLNQLLSDIAGRSGSRAPRTAAQSTSVLRLLTEDATSGAGGRGWTHRSSPACSTPRPETLPARPGTDSVEPH